MYGAHIISICLFNIGVSHCVKDGSGKSVINSIIIDSSSDLCLPS